MGSQVLLTGGSGFLGCYLMEALVERGENVVNYDLRAPSGERAWLLGEKLDEVSLERGSIEDLSTLLLALKKHRIEKIIHNAAVVDPPYLLTHPMLAYRINIGGTLNVLEAARILGIPKVVYVSSNAVFTSKQYEPIDEEHPVILPSEGPGTGPYSISKLASEAFGMSYADTFGLDFVALRPSSFYGLGMVYPLYVKPMVENSVNKAPTRFQTGRDLPRDYTYVRDTASAVIKALDAPERTLEDRIFLVATGRKLVTAGEVAQVVREFIPDADIEIGAGLTEWNKREMKYRGVISIERARSQLGFEPRYGIREGVGEYIRLYRDYLAAET